MKRSIFSKIPLSHIMVILIRFIVLMIALKSPVKLLGNINQTSCGSITIFK